MISTVWSTRAAHGRRRSDYIGPRIRVGMPLIPISAERNLNPEKSDRARCRTLTACDGLPAVDQQAAEVRDGTAPRDIRRKQNPGRRRGSAFRAGDRPQARRVPDRDIARLDQIRVRKSELARIQIARPPPGHALLARHQARKGRQPFAPRPLALMERPTA